MLTCAWTDLVGATVAGQFHLRALIFSGRRQAEFLASPANSPADQPAISVTLLDPRPEQVDEELSRVETARRLSHPNLLNVLDGGKWPLPGGEVIYIAAEAAEGTLAQTVSVGPLSDAAARDLLTDLVSGLEYLHAQGLVYRVLGPETIVRAGNRWKLGDLGELHRTGTLSPSEVTFAMDPKTTPPEAGTGAVLPAWDIWMLGLTLQEALGAKGGAAKLLAPFDAVVRGCQEPDPERRISLGEIRRLLGAEKAGLEAAPPEPAPAPIAAPPEEAAGEKGAHLVSRRVLVLVGVLACICLALLYWSRHQPVAPAPPAKAPPRAVPKPRPEPERSARIPRPSPFSGQVAESPRLAAPAPPATRTVLAQPAPTSVAQSTPGAPVKSGASEAVGRADYLSDSMAGRLTASGEPFSGDSMSAAHRTLPLGTRLRVTNLENNRSVIVRVNDRGAYRQGFIISLTRGAAEQLGFVRAGSARVRIEVMP